jgi:hypothetical protein
MKEYLKALIMEQIDRGLYLKKLIPYPLKYPELSSLAERCSKIIDDNIISLKYLLNELEKRGEDELRDIYRGFKMLQREIELVECYGIPTLYYVTEEIGYLNKIIFRIHQEINLPLTPPSVACISTNYYYFHPFTNVIFVPLGESNFLLHLPDIFHELGHEVFYNRESELRLRKVDESYRKAIIIITNYYKELWIRKTRETGPEEIPRRILSIHSLWKDYWMEEFFCDLFACYVVGPAYAWSHFHLATKKTEDAYSLSQKHPSVDSRTKMLSIALTKLGFKNEATSLLSKWKNMPFIANIEPITEYQYAYPINLMEEIADVFLTGLKESGFSIISPEKLEKLNQNSIVKLLNEAWKVFWNEPPMEYRNWEEKAVEKLKSAILS